MAGRLRTSMLFVAFAACAVLAVVLGVRPLSAWGTMATNDAVETVLPLAVAVPCCIAAAHRSSGRRRWSWALLAAGCASWGLGQVLWSWFELVSETEPFPSLADAGFLGAVPLLVLGVARHPAGVLPMGRVRLVVDGAIIVTALLFAAAGTFLGQIWDANSGTALERGLLIAYPASDVLVVAVAVALVARRREGLRGPLGLLIAGVCSLAIADSAFAWLTSQSDHSDPITDLFWPVGFLLIAVAAHRSIGADEIDEPDARPATRMEAWLPQAPVALAAIVLAVRALNGDDLGPFLGVTGAVLLVLIVVRQAFVQLENGELNTVLEGTVAELQAREDELEYRALHDHLTGLANRALFRDRLHHATSRRHGGDVTVLYVDLDDFKTINDTMGHDAGDRLLVLLAERLRACVREGDTVARLGGDEFAVLLDEGDAAEGADLGVRILSALEVPFSVAGRELRIRASVGVVSAQHGAASAEQLLQDADLAMYAAKDAGGSRVERFDPVMRSDAVDRMDLLGDLEGVLHRGELELRHQPVVRLATGEVAGHEVLLRWNHPERGLLSPGAFLDLAEETGLIVPIGWWVMEEACRGLAARGGTNWVTVNLSVRQLQETDVVDRVSAVLSRTRLEPRRLIIEITERALAEGAEIVETMRRLRGLGLRIAIDDFGTGYSSLAALASLPLDALKIDGSFIARLDTVEGEVLVRAIVDLARALGLRAVAEGVEQPWQLRKLLDIGCDGAQGYLIGRPSPVPIGESAVPIGSLLTP